MILVWARLQNIVINRDETRKIASKYHCVRTDRSNGRNQGDEVESDKHKKQTLLNPHS